MSQTRINTNPHIEDFILEKNKFFPNSELPVLIYREALQLPAQKNKAGDIAQQIFLRNNWQNTWRNGIYDFHHYHSNTHECLAVVSGNAAVILGGPGGKKMELNTGDVLILPAGTGHKAIKVSADFVCIGAYPEGKDYDINHGKKEELEKVMDNLAKVPKPASDPVFGKEGFLKSYWK